MDDGFMRDEWRGLDRLLGAEDRAGRTARRGARGIERAEHRAGASASGAASSTATREDTLLPHIWETVVNKVRIASPNEEP